MSLVSHLQRIPYFLLLLPCSFSEAAEIGLVIDHDVLRELSKAVRVCMPCEIVYACVHSPSGM